MSSEEELRYLILAAQREGARTLSDLLAPLGATPAQAEALRCLKDARVPLTLHALGGRLVCEGGSPSRLVSTLVDRGWVERTENPANRREVLLRLTAEGEALELKVRMLETSIYSWIGETLSAADQQLVITALRQLITGSSSAASISRRQSDQKRLTNDSTILSLKSV